MRDLLFKNLTSKDKKRRILCSSEIADQQGVRSVIRRHFICIMKEVKQANTQRSSPNLYVLKERNYKEQREKFFYRIKGSIYAVHDGRLYLIVYMHSLKIVLSGLPQDSIQDTV